MHKIPDMQRRGGLMGNGGKHQVPGRDRPDKHKRNRRTKCEHKGRRQSMRSEEDVPQEEAYSGCGSSE